MFYLRLQAWAPSNHPYATFLLPRPPQFLYQAPPGAQQLALPDFLNVPHRAHVIASVVEVMGSVPTEMLTGVLRMSSLSGIGRRDTYSRVNCVLTGVGTDAHTRRDIDPYESTNIFVLLAFE